MSDSQATSHTTAHSHDHHHGHGHNFATENQKFFDEQAKEYDARPDVQTTASRAAGAMRREFPSLFDEDNTTVMDYACGTGALSRELCPYVKSIVGVDISQGMIDQYNTRVRDQGLSPEEMQAIRVELKGEDSELDGTKFDLIVCCAAYHHFASIDDTTRVLQTFLKPGGSLLVVDFAQSADNSENFTHKFAHIVPHTHGFNEEIMMSTFSGAGLVDVSYTIADQAKLHGQEVSIFLARGVKAAS